MPKRLFLFQLGDGYHIRWFTPYKEVNLCGHATLASAYVLFNILGYKEKILAFESLSGRLFVIKKGDLLTLDSPVKSPQICNIPIHLEAGLGKASQVYLKHDDYIVVFETEEEVLSIAPNHELLKQLDLRGVIITAPSTMFDFVARFFAPKYGIPEDPVTGSAYTQLIPYWSSRLGKSQLKAKQISSRGGKLFVSLETTE